MGMSEMTLYRAIAAGEFPAVRIGRRLLVPARVLERMAELAISTGREVSAAEISGQAS
ncbi:helix-turn-helix domain-containing protein [Kribbella sandramycini]|nr:helix-turn-helix domain-containing protein [Kribbella sandramycini]